MKVVSRQWSVLTKNDFCFALSVFLFAPGSFAEAQQPTKVPRIGFLFSLSPAVNTDRIEAFRQGMRDLGYVEGKNVVVEYRYAEGKLDRLSELAAELARLKVDVIVSGGPAVTRPRQGSNSYDSHRDGAG